MATKKSFYLSIIQMLCLGTLFVVPTHTIAEDYLYRMLRACSKGDINVCNKLKELSKKLKVQADRINDQADDFLVEARSLGIENGNTPDIRKAYPIILKRHMSSDTVEPAHRKKGLKSELVKVCATQLHDYYFLYGKEIPALESGRPDWGMLYLVVIYHYFRHCTG